MAFRPLRYSRYETGYDYAPPEYSRRVYERRYRDYDREYERYLRDRYERRRKDSRRRDNSRRREGSRKRDKGPRMYKYDVPRPDDEYIVLENPTPELLHIAKKHYEPVLKQREDGRRKHSGWFKW
jgi:hypothetical protein